MNITYVPDIYHPDSFQTISIDDAVRAVKSNSYKNLVENIRAVEMPTAEETKKKRDRLKKKLPAFSFGGTFEESVKNENLVTASGLFHFDIDGLSDAKADKVKIINSFNGCLVTLFVSTSGNGLKGCLAVDGITNDDTYKKVFSFFNSEFSNLGFTLDEACKDVRRLCFISHDPEIYYNPEANPFKILEKQEPPPPPKKDPPKVKSGSINSDFCIKQLENIFNNAAPGTRHNTRLKAGKLAGGYVAAGRMSQDQAWDILQQLSDAVADGGTTNKSENKTLSDAFNEGLKDPAFSKNDPKQDDIEIDVDWDGHKQDSSNKAPPKNDSTFKLISAGELLTKSIKHDWLVHKLFECNNLGQFFGETGSGKSFVILDLAYCIASGLDFCGLPVKQGNVVYICGEGYSGLTRRIKALQIKYNSDVSQKLFISEQPAAFMNSVVTADVAKAIESVGDVNLVVVDTLHRNMGGGSEDSADDFGIILKNIDTYLKPLGVTTLIVHHCGHANQDRARGSYSIRASMDFEYQVVMNGSKITVKNTKMKDGETPKPLAFDLTQVEIGSDDDGEVITSAYLEYRGEVSQAKEKSKVKLKGKEELILNKLIALTRDQGIKPTQAIINEFSRYFSGTLNSHKKVLPFDTWRSAARLLISESDPKNERTNFLRMKKKFYDAGLLCEFDGYIWPILDYKHDDNIDIDSFINNL